MNRLLYLAKQGREIAKNINDHIRELPDGVYKTTITSIELKTRKDGTSQYFMIGLVVQTEGFQGYKIPVILSLREESLKNTIYQIEDLLHVLGLELDDASYENFETLNKVLRERLTANPLRRYEVEARLTKTPNSIRVEFLRNLAKKS